MSIATILLWLQALAQSKTALVALVTGIGMLVTDWKNNVAPAIAAILAAFAAVSGPTPPTPPQTYGRR